MLPQQLVGNLLGSFPFYGGAIVLILGALAVGSEYGWGTLKTLFTQRAGRLQIFAAQMLALGIALVPFVLLIVVLGAVCSGLIALREGAAVVWPSAWDLGRLLVAGWFILAVWTAFGVMLAVLSRGTALAIGVGILYILAIEGIFSALANQSDLLRPLVKGFVRANAYSLIKPLSNPLSSSVSGGGPGAFAGPYVGVTQAFLVLLAYLAAFLVIAGLVLRRRDVV